MERTIPFDKLPDGMKELMIDSVGFRRELTKESDRGCALLAAAHLEYMLEKALRKKLCGSNGHLNSLFDFNGPLGTFSARILMTYSLGLFSKKHLNDIQLIRKVRNEFGHSADILSFEDFKITNLTKNLKLVANSLATNSRNRFISSTFFISGTLERISIAEAKIDEAHEVDVEERKKTTDKYISLIKKMLK